MNRIKTKKKSPRPVSGPTPRRLAVRLTPDDAIEIDYEPSNPPHVFFDTNVLRGLSKKGMDALRRLGGERGFQFRYSMLNFTELASHLGDAPSEETPYPFRKFQAPFKKIVDLFHLDVLPSAETVLMQGSGLERYLDPKWVVNPADIARQVRIIASAHTVDGILRYGIDPGHYRHLREIDGKSFVRMMAGATQTINRPLRVTQDSATWLLHLYSFLIYRASSKRTRLALLSLAEQRRVITFFREKGGKMLEAHLLRLLQRTINDGRLGYANDLYDMLQLLLLRDPNLLFVTDDRPFFSYYMGSEHHRVVPWKGFQASAG